MKIDILREDSKFKIDPKGIAKIVKETHDIMKQKGDNFQMYVRIWNPTRPSTFKVDDEGI